MNDAHITDLPTIYPDLLSKCKEIGFTMPSDVYIGTFLKSLISSKPNGRFLELGTGIGLSLAWMMEGLTTNASLITIDNDPQLVEIAQSYFGKDPRVEIICEDGSEWFRSYKGPKFDLIFADAWPGKFWDLDLALDLIKEGGFYVIDDLNPESDWPEGHQGKVDAIIRHLEQHPNFTLTKMNWSTGIIVAVKQGN